MQTVRSTYVFWLARIAPRAGMLHFDATLGDVPTTDPSRTDRTPQ